MSKIIKFPRKSVRTQMIQEMNLEKRDKLEADREFHEAIEDLLFSIDNLEQLGYLIQRSSVALVEYYINEFTTHGSDEETSASNAVKLTKSFLYSIADKL